jgi:hypothetical protein
MSSRQPTDDEPIWLTQKSVVIDDPGGASRVVEPTPADLGQLPEEPLQAHRQPPVVDLIVRLDTNASRRVRNQPYEHGLRDRDTPSIV